MKTSGDVLAKVWSLLIAAFITIVSNSVFSSHIIKSEVDALDARCEAARKVSLAPVIEQAVADCVKKGRNDEAGCRFHFRDYGELVLYNGKVVRPRLFMDLPICVEAWETKRHFLKEPPGPRLPQ